MCRRYGDAREECRLVRDLSNHSSSLPGTVDSRSRICWTAVRSSRSGAYSLCAVGLSKKNLRCQHASSGTGGIRQMRMSDSLLCAAFCGVLQLDKWERVLLFETLLRKVWTIQISSVCSSLSPTRTETLSLQATYLSRRDFVRPSSVSSVQPFLRPSTTSSPSTKPAHALSPSSGSLNNLRLRPIRSSVPFIGVDEPFVRARLLPAAPRRSTASSSSDSDSDSTRL